MATFGTRLHVFCADTARKSNSISWIDRFSNHVTLVSCDHNRCAWKVFVQLRVPLFNFFKTILVCHVVHDQCTFAIAVVTNIQCMIALLPSSVPNRKANFSFRVNHDFLLVKGCVNSRLLFFAEFIFAVFDCQ